MHDQAITNAYIIHKSNFPEGTSPKPQKQFRLQLAYSLVSQAYELRKNLGRPYSVSLSRLSEKHYIYRSSVRKQCVVCAYKKTSPRGKKYKDTKIMTYCPKCDVHLCVGKCFEAYHSRVNYKRF